MNKVLQEIKEIPQRAFDLLNSGQSEALPTGVPYLGMGSSYFAPLAFKYMGCNIQPELASEYFNYLAHDVKRPLAVILSQSGRSSEALWCTRLFEQYVAISNDNNSPLCIRDNVKQRVCIMAGEEHYSSSKTYTNTLLALFKGLGIDPGAAVNTLAKRMSEYERIGKELADAVYTILQQRPIHGIYITGSGPNIATAQEAALILSESTKLNVHGLPMAQYDHGPKETANNSIVIQVLAKGKSYERSMQLTDTIRTAGAHVFTVEEPGVEENLSVLNNIVPFNFMAYYLAELLNVSETFLVGGKITEVK